MTPQETVTLREHFDEKIGALRADFDEMKTANAAEHHAVLAKLDGIEKHLSKTVTWPALTTAVVTFATLVSVAAALIKLFG